MQAFVEMIGPEKPEGHGDMFAIASRNGKLISIFPFPKPSAFLFIQPISSQLAHRIGITIPVTTRFRQVCINSGQRSCERLIFNSTESNHICIDKTAINRIAALFMSFFTCSDLGGSWLGVT
jgi:hypothetical protein